jgi:hypothetical protein
MEALAQKSAPFDENNDTDKKRKFSELIIIIYLPVIYIHLFFNFHAVLKNEAVQSIHLIKTSGLPVDGESPKTDIQSKMSDVIPAPN